MAEDVDLFWLIDEIYKEIDDGAGSYVRLSRRYRYARWQYSVGRYPIDNAPYEHGQDSAPQVRHFSPLLYDWLYLKPPKQALRERPKYQAPGLESVA